MPEHAWSKLQNMWIGFFAVVGVINLAVAYTCSTDTWVNFKLFGLMALTLVFTIGVGVFMTKYAVNRQNIYIQCITHPWARALFFHFSPVRDFCSCRRQKQDNSKCRRNFWFLVLQP